MSPPKMALLPDRGVVRLSGADALSLLDAVVTNAVDQVPVGGTVLMPPLVYCGLLSPQGKILHDMLVTCWADDVLIDVERSRAAELVKRLTLYRLRAKVTIKDDSDNFAVVAAWGELDQPTQIMLSHIDPRHPGMGRRGYFPLDALQRLPGEPRDGAAGYNAQRIALGVPEGGKDWDFGDAFPHEANFDLLNGVSFTKGCYVGQEIVARMEHRGTVRKRVARVTGDADLAGDRPDVMVADVVIGKLGSAAGRQGLALLRLDRAIEAIDKGATITAAGIRLDIDEAMIARQRALMAAKASAP